MGGGRGALALSKHKSIFRYGGNGGAGYAGLANHMLYDNEFEEQLILLGFGLEEMDTITRLCE